MASLDRHAGGVWRVRFRFGGTSFFRSLDTEDETVALGIKASIEETISLIRRGRLDLPDGADPDTTWLFLLSGGRITAEPIVEKPTTLGAVVDEYLAAIPAGSKEFGSIYTERIHAKHLQTILGKSLPITSIDRGALQRYVNSRAKKVAAVTIGKELQTLRQVWDYAGSEGLVKGEFPRRGVRLPKAKEKPPFRIMKEINREIRQQKLAAEEQTDLWESLFLTEKEILGLLNYVEKHAKYPFILPMFAFACFTGARRSEIIRSEVSDFRLDDGFVLVREKKRRQSVQLSYRQVQLNSRLGKIMRKWFSNHPGGRYTICQSANAARNELEQDESTSLTKGAATHHFKSTLAGSKWRVIKGFHTLRHSFASICAMRGVPEATINAWMGHQTEEMRERYRHLYPDQQQAAMAKLFTVADLFDTSSQ